MNNQLTDTQNKLRKIGVIGKWICNVGLLISFFVAVTYIALVFQSEEFSSHRTGTIKINFIAPDKNLSSTVTTQANAAVEKFVNQSPLYTYQTYMLTHFLYMVAIGFFIFLLRKICIEFSQCNFFNAKNARHLNLIGWLFLGWYLASLVENLFFPTQQIFTGGMNINLLFNPEGKPWFYLFEAELVAGYIPSDPLILPLALVFLAFGWAIKQSIALQEEQSLTI